jgi:hypothetical protein
MDTLFLLIIAILLGLILADFEKFMGQRNPLLPLRYLPRKNSIMDADSDLDALYYTDMLYPVYGKETILAIQRLYRHCTHQAFDLSFDVHFASEANKKEKKIEYLIQEVNRILLERNLTMMMQANLDVLNGKMTIKEARRQTVDTVDINNALIPPLASRQIAIDIHAGVNRDISEYLNYEFLKTEERKRYDEQKREKTSDEKNKS